MAGQSQGPLHMGKSETEAQKEKSIHHVTWCIRTEEDEFGFWSSFPPPFTPHLKHIPLGKVNASFILQPSDSWPSSSLHPTGGRSIRHSTGSTPRQCVVPVESLHLSGHLTLGETHCPTLVLRTEGSWGLGSAWGSSC